jgi:beta-1,4-mannosyl-glycoprotein beta-1,4-N-acetylglucosaminyltransferase
MKIFDCFTYMNEDVVLDLRLNYLNDFVEKFIIVESHFFHNGKKKKLNFDINKFSKFKHKIIYLVLDHEPDDVESIDKTNSDDVKNSKHILNGMRRDFHQRNFIKNGLQECHEDDLVLISDIDEIPKIENLKLSNIKNELIFFKQKMFYYKFNLCSSEVDWYGSRACKKKNLISPQWLRNLKAKTYPFWRLDIIFSKNKSTNIKFINDGGWHFSYLNAPEEIENKLKNYAHYREFELNLLNLEKIKQRILNKTSIYNLAIDMKKSKFTSGQKLETVSIEILPKYLMNNKHKYSDWLD